MMSQSQILVLEDLVLFLRKRERENGLSAEESTVVAQVFPLVIQHGSQNVCEIFEEISDGLKADQIRGVNPSRSFSGLN